MCEPVLSLAMPAAAVKKTPSVSVSIRGTFIRTSVAITRPADRAAVCLRFTGRLSFTFDLSYSAPRSRDSRMVISNRKYSNELYMALAIGRGDEAPI